MVLGASITAGWGSKDSEGYRPELLRRLKENGNKAEYVGTQTCGTQKDACEAYPGKTVAQLDEATQESAAFELLPHIILINVGTNDCNMRGDPPEMAPDAFTVLLSHIYAQAPAALVVISSLLHNLNDGVNPCIKTLNEGLRRVSREARAGGQKTEFSEMYDAVPVSHISKEDGTHPDEAGYARMAEMWFEAIERTKDKISTPVMGEKALASGAAREAGAGADPFAWAAVSILLGLGVILR